MGTTVQILKKQDKGRNPLGNRMFVIPRRGKGRENTFTHHRGTLFRHANRSRQRIMQSAGSRAGNSQQAHLRAGTPDSVKSLTHRY